MSISYTVHAKENLNYYGISMQDVKNVLDGPERIFLDLKTGRLIAIGRWLEDKYLVVVFEKNDDTTVITVFPTSKIDKMVERRITKGRWMEI
jgi:uncharacterized DUF497 family protein